jgi:hypothetical protein
MTRHSPRTAGRAASFASAACACASDKRDGRCVVITIDPVSTERNAEVLRTVARDLQGCLGVYGTTVEPGRVALNDAVLVESAA